MNESIDEDDIISLFSDNKDMYEFEGVHRYSTISDQIIIEITKSTSNINTLSKLMQKIIMHKLTVKEYNAIEEKLRDINEYIIKIGLYSVLVGHIILTRPDTERFPNLELFSKKLSTIDSMIVKNFNTLTNYWENYNRTHSLI